MFYRLLLATVIAASGSVVGVLPLAAQLLSLAGFMFMQARIHRRRYALGADPSLAVLSQFPVPEWRIYDYQIRDEWRSACWLIVDAAGFWAVAWCIQESYASLWWLPVVALAQVGITLAMSDLLFRLWPVSGCLSLAILAIMVWGTLQHDKIPWLWTGVQPLMQAVAWLTPWGWLNTLAQRLPQEGYVMGVGALALAIMAAISLFWTRQHIRRSWRLFPAWREVAGRPQRVPLLRNDRDLPAIRPENQAVSECAAPPGDPAAVIEARGVQVTASWHHARNAVYGLGLESIAWAGRQARARFQDDDACVAHLLMPEGASMSLWRWTLLLVALPAVCGVAGISGLWGLGALAAILAFQRRIGPTIGVLIAMGIATAAPQFTEIIVIVIPCLFAMLISMPFAGGTWKGLPMGSTVLGGIPRSWAQMMRIMMTLTTCRLLCGVPIVALAAIALGSGIHPAFGAACGAAWFACLLSVPWLTALHLNKRTPVGLADIGLGTWWLSLLNAGCILLQMGTGVAIIGGACLLTVKDLSLMPGLVIAGIGVGGSLLLSCGHVPLLRYGYRHRIDLIPPA